MRNEQKGSSNPPAAKPVPPQTVNPLTSVNTPQPITRIETASIHEKGVEKRDK